ncbi:MAG: translocation/assembly module TamB domain-containing protein [Magnetococcales bacterium]|nr:translocation/assembly module TamB domain-containing protein [Magnetococcales bacterium]
MPRLRWKRLFRIALPLLLILAIPPFLLGTESGLQALLHLSQPLLKTIGIALPNACQGRIAGALRCEKVLLSDDNGVWLSLDNLAAEWDWRAIEERRLRLHSLRASQVHLQRLPETTGSAPTWPLIDIARLEAPTITLDAAVAGRATTLSLAGRATLQTDGALDGLLELTAREGSDLSLRLEGRIAGEITLSARLRESAGGLLAKGGPLLLDLTGTGPPDNWKGQFQGELPGQLTLKGEIEASWPSRRIQGRLIAHQAHPLIREGVTGLFALAPVEKGWELRNLRLQGSGWSVQGDVALSDTNALSGTLTSNLSKDGPWSSWSNGAVEAAELQWSLSANLSEPHLSGRGRVISPLAETVHLHLDGEPLPQARIQGGLLASGVHLKKGALPRPGRLNVEVDLPPWTAGSELPPLPLRADWQDLSSGRKEIDALLGKEIRATARLQFPSGQRFHLDNLEILGKGARLKGTIQGDSATWGGPLQLEVDNLSLALGEVGGKLRADSHLLIRQGDFQLTGRLRGEKLTAAGLTGGSWQSRLDLSPHGLELREITLALGGITGSGWLTLPEKGDLRANLAFSAPRFVWAEQLTLAGAEGTLLLEPVEKRTVARLRLNAEHLRSGSHLSAKAITLDGESTDPFGAANGTWRWQSREGFAGPLIWDRATGKGQLLATGSTFQVDTTRQKDRGRLEGRFNREATGWQLQLEQLRLTTPAHQVTLTRQTTLHVSPKGSVSGQANLLLDEAPLELQASLTASEIDLTAHGKNLPLALLALWQPDPELTGTADWQLSVSGPRLAPRGSMRVESRGIGVPAARLHGLHGVVEARLSAERLDASLSLEGLPGQPLSARVALPLIPNRDGLPQLSPHAPLSGHLSWKGPLEEIGGLLPWPTHQVQGTLGLEASLSGSGDSPLVKGSWELADGTYENLEWGTLLRQMILKGSFAWPGSLEATFQATDGKRGKVNGQLAAPLSRDIWPPPFQGEVTMHRLPLAKRDDLRLVLDGSAALMPTPDGHLLQGRLTCRSAEIHLAESAAARIPKLHIVEGGVDASPKPRQEPVATRRVLLDLQVDVPNRAFVRATDLESEWQGRVNIGGYLEEPTWRGTLSLVQGRLGVLGKTFQMEQGQVVLNGAEPPQLNLQATHQSQSLKTLVLISGTSRAPEIAVSSVPSLPRDEILSRLLYDKGMGNLGPGEVLAVGRAASKLAGLGTEGPGMVDQVRNALRLDVLSFGAASGPGVEVGKYLKEGLYVGVEQGMTADSAAIKTQIDLSPRVVLETRTSQDKGADIGVNYKINY